MSGLSALLEVQDHDTACDQLAHRRATLPERSALADLDARRRAHAARVAEVAARRADAASREAGLDGQVGAMDERVAGLERRLYSGEVTATRDLLAMTEEIEQIKARRAGLDGDVLAVMEESETLDAASRALAAEGADLDEQRSALLAAVAAAEAVIDAEVAEIAARRAAAVAGVPAGVLETYEQLRAKLGGVGAARLVGTSCTGCHLTLPAAEVARVKREPADAVILCDSCGRILVR